MKRLPRLLSTLGLAAAALAASLSAHAIGRLVDVQIVDRDSGARLPVYRHQGEWWVAGQPGARYAIEVRNASGQRVLSVMAVDGVNIVSGDSASWQQTGYVLAPWQTAQIAGWRKSQAEIAAFHFTNLPDSYAARTGRPHDVGVIGVAVFRERAVPPPRHPMLQRDELPAAGDHASSGVRESAPAAADAAATPAVAAEARVDAELAQRGRAVPAAPRLGTGHGERESAPVGSTHFERRAAQPDEIITLRYDSRANLVAAGIIAPDTPQPGPRPFPASARYVPDPPAAR